MSWTHKLWESDFGYRAAFRSVTILSLCSNIRRARNASEVTASLFDSATRDTTGLVLGVVNFS